MISSRKIKILLPIILIFIGIIFAFTVILVRNNSTEKKRESALAHHKSESRNLELGGKITDLWGVLTKANEDGRSVPVLFKEDVTGLESEFVQFESTSKFRAEEEPGFYEVKFAFEGDSRDESENIKFMQAIVNYDGRLEVLVYSEDPSLYQLAPDLTSTGSAVTSVSELDTSSEQLIYEYLSTTNDHVSAGVDFKEDKKYPVDSGDIKDADNAFLSRVDALIELISQ